MLNETLSEKTIWRRLFHQLIGRKLLSKAVLHFTSTEERATVVSSLSNRPSFILPNLITLPAISCIAPPSDPCKFTIVYLGRLHPQKNLESLLAALSSLSWVDCCLIVGVGEIDYEGRLRKVAIDRGIDDKVRWLGWADEATKFTLLGQVDLMVLPSFSESYANVVVESLAMGTAVLTTDRVGLANYITEKQFGWVVPPTAEGLAQGITQAYADSARRAYVRREAPKRVRYDFDQTRLTQYYLAAYRDHLGL
jgi:glycosyltransferase involved in cell wall biosynthesis